MAMFLKSGPARIVREGWSVFTILPLFLCFLAVFGTLAGKMYLLQDMMPDSSGWATAELAGVWATFLLLPQFLLSIFALYKAAGCRRLFPIIAQFPALLATPMLTTITFGPHTEKGFVAFSTKYTVINIVMTLVMAVALVFVSGHFYALSYGDMVATLGCLVLGLLATLFLSMSLQFPNSKMVKCLFLDMFAIQAVLDTGTGESENIVRNKKLSNKNIS